MSGFGRTGTLSLKKFGFSKCYLVQEVFEHPDLSVLDEPYPRVNTSDEFISRSGNPNGAPNGSPNGPPGE